MPYIKNDNRKKFEKGLSMMPDFDNKGELEYCIFYSLTHIHENFLVLVDEDSPIGFNEEIIQLTFGANNSFKSTEQPCMCLSNISYQSMGRPGNR